MKFICLRYLDRNTWNSFSDGQRRTFLQECLIYDNKLRESGHFFAAEAVQAAGDAVGLHRSCGQLVVEDDLHTRTHELLGGLMFLEARDLNHAIVLVSDHPGVRAGWFKIHPAEDTGVIP
ncbi:MAG: YciI family protein [Pseudobdellovibrionaceae bacterium]|nr:YciI family protein [Pseudobdellovibrionaceae bacterium]